MEPIRVVGRIDLAQPVHAALVAAGADARLATAAPGAVVAATGRDGTDIDVLVNGFEVCPGIKKIAPRRPVVMVVWDPDASGIPERMATWAARTSRGPDAHLAWPATGAEILAACERALAAAPIARPRFSWRIELARWIPVVVLAVLGASAWGAPSVWSRLLLRIFVIGAFAWLARSSWAKRNGPHRLWHRFWMVAALIFAALNVLEAVALVVR